MLIFKNINIEQSKPFNRLIVKQIEGMARQRGADEEPVTIPQPLLSNYAWTNFMRGQTNQVPTNAVNVYGNHPDYQWEWKQDEHDYSWKWQKVSEDKVAMPIYGPVDWDSLWPDWQSVGNQFEQTGTPDDPLSLAQRIALREQMLKSNYVIRSFDEQLGRGVYGTVWRVVCQKRQLHGLPGIPGREFWAACKVIRLRTEFRDSNWDWFLSVNAVLKDMHALRYVNHKNLVKYYDIIPIPDTQTKFPYSTVLVLMELCDGDLQDVIDLNGGPLPLDFCRKWMRDIALGVQYLHNDRNMTHLDIKPQNIMFQFSCADAYRPLADLANIFGQLETITFKLCDLGICQSFTEQSALTTEYGGTEMWCAPEMKALKGVPLPNRVPISAKPCDVYSLGATLAFVLMPIQVYESHVDNDTLSQYMANVMNGQVIDQRVTKKFAQLIAFMIHPQPGKRPTINQVLQHNFLKPFATRDEKRKRDFISMRDIEERQRPKKRMKGYSLQ